MTVANVQKLSAERAAALALRELRCHSLNVTPNGDAIKAIRTAQGVSIRALSLSTGLNRGYLSRLERGLIAHPSDDKVALIAAAMQVSTSAITHKETPT
ncbi:helix-turn-helix domain-containing protein [Streptomyces bacillaris]|uniref:helix-turn-helix domain-containing protein n=1 Tax=Streptomyces bacillaris TaxID=68179 RepID=UPI0037F62B95